jgi:RimJ/RimL family protein N-acetyltransferase
MNPLVLRAAQRRDLDAFVDHALLHAAESGQEGSPRFALSRSLDRMSVRYAVERGWALRIDEPDWMRAWLLLDGPSRVIGHAELRGGRFSAELHRATLGMGLQRPHTRQGHGGRLLAAALAWARSEHALAWVDLGVFSTNLPARKLYARAGFIETATRPDAFRLDDGVRVDDVQMTLSLAAERIRSRF